MNTPSEIKPPPPPALSMPRLPTELTDYIIDFHYSDRKSLEICSLVCRNWLPASRFHLFKIFGVQQFNVHSFVKLLASPSSTIASHVRTFHIYTHSVDVPVFDVIAPYFEEFIAVKSIVLEGFHLAPVSEESLSRGLGRIGTMELTGISYDLTDHWFGFTFTVSDGGPSTFSSRLRVLHSIIYGIGSSSWLSIVAQFPVVTQLDLSYIRDIDLRTVQTVLKSGGQSIRTIKLYFFRRARLGTSN
jgi:hypothetical protein